MNPVHIYLRDSAAPDIAKRAGQRRCIASGEYFVDECDVVTGWKDQRKLFLGRSENVVDAVERRVNNVDVFQRW